MQSLCCCQVSPAGKSRGRSNIEADQQLAPGSSRSACSGLARTRVGARLDPTGSSFAIRSVWSMPSTNPKTAPDIVAHGPVRNQRSRPTPSRAGPENSRAIVVIREAQANPTESTDCDSRSSFTHDSPHPPSGLLNQLSPQPRPSAKGGGPGSTESPRHSRVSDNFKGSVILGRPLVSTAHPPVREIFHKVDNRHLLIDLARSDAEPSGLGKRCSPTVLARPRRPVAGSCVHFATADRNDEFWPEPLILRGLAITMAGLAIAQTLWAASG